MQKASPSLKADHNHINHKQKPRKSISSDDLIQFTVRMFAGTIRN